MLWMEDGRGAGRSRLGAFSFILTATVISTISQVRKLRPREFKPMREPEFRPRLAGPQGLPSCPAGSQSFVEAALPAGPVLVSVGFC